VGKTKVKGVMKLVDYDPEAENDEDGHEQEGAATNEEHHDTPKKANNNASNDTKPKTPQRPFWAVTADSFSTPVVKPVEDDEPKGGRKRGQDERKYDDVFNELGIKKSSNR